MKEKIETCPLCGGNAYYSYGSQLGDSYSEGWEYHSITCEKCELYLSIEGDEPKENIFKSWNTRTEIKE